MTSTLCRMRFGESLPSGMVLRLRIGRRKRAVRRGYQRGRAASIAFDYERAGASRLLPTLRGRPPNEHVVDVEGRYARLELAAASARRTCVPSLAGRDGRDVRVVVGLIVCTRAWRDTQFDLQVLPR